MVKKIYRTSKRAKRKVGKDTFKRATKIKRTVNTNDNNNNDDVSRDSLFVSNGNGNKVDNHISDIKNIKNKLKSFIGEMVAA